MSVPCCCPTVSTAVALPISYGPIDLFFTGICKMDNMSLARDACWWSKPKLEGPSWSNLAQVQKADQG